MARSAYVQLRFSPALLVLTVLGMALLYLVPPLAVAALPWHGGGATAIAGLLAWLAMALAYAPTLARYGQPLAAALLLPLTAALYVAMTVDSALAHHRGRGGRWKGRVHARDG